MKDETTQSEAETNWAFNPESKTTKYAGNDMGVATATGVPLPEIEPVRWTASEYISHEKDASWYIGLLAFGGIVSAAIYLIVDDIFAAIATLLGCISMGAYAARKPTIRSYTLDEKGLHVDDQFYPYSRFRSFSVVEEGAIDSIWLKPFKRVSPPVVMYFSPEEEQKIIDLIANFLPHQQRELDAVDRFSKKIRF